MTEEKNIDRILAECEENLNSIIRGIPDRPLREAMRTITDPLIDLCKQIIQLKQENSALRLRIQKLISAGQEFIDCVNRD